MKEYNLIIFQTVNYTVQGLPGPGFPGPGQGVGWEGGGQVIDWVWG